MTMIVKYSGTQVGFSAAAEEGGEGEGEEWREKGRAIEVDVRVGGAKSDIKVETGKAMNVAPRISPRMSGKSPSLVSSSLSLSFITALVRASACSTATSTFAGTLASSVSASKQEEGRRTEGPGEALRYDA